MLTVITNIILTVMVTIASVRMPVNTLKQDVITPVEQEIVTGSINMENKTENSLLENESYGEKKIQKQESQTDGSVKPSNPDTSFTNSNIVGNSESEIVSSDQDKIEKANEALQAALESALHNTEEQSVNEDQREETAVKESIEESPVVEASEDIMEQPSVAVARNFTPPAEIEEEAPVEGQAYEEEITSPVFEDYRQTFYSVESGEVKVGYGLEYDDSQIRNIDNVMHFYDDEYEWLPIVAVNIDEVLEVGLDERGIPNYYGTILEITYPEGETQKAIVLDACGACSWDNRIDLWVYSHDYEHDVKGIQYRVVREGFKEDEEQQGS